ncbi:MAG TPA: amino acid ABC transporter ATP-binding protein [Rhodocyclaceae bacterium]|nr:amino acid ABC transporter ATP-binding protein [Rhodocyclaceae bacterium]
MSIIEVNNISKRFGSVVVLNDVSFTLDAGKTLAIVGRSGSGKSTLLRCLNGLETINSGTISIAEHFMSRDPGLLRQLRREGGIVFQSYNLFPHLSAGANVMLALVRVLKKSRAEAHDIAMASLKDVGLADRFDSFPDQLSGGQQQRVAIARSLAMKPKVMLFDEVTSGLDPELTYEVLRTMEQLAASGMTSVLVTHEMNFARRIADTVAFMHNGKLHEMGPAAELFENPKTSELASFLSQLI